jgi:hypothetical protein
MDDLTSDSHNDTWAPIPMQPLGGSGTGVDSFPDIMPDSMDAVDPGRNGAPFAFIQEHNREGTTLDADFSEWINLSSPDPPQVSGSSSSSAFVHGGRSRRWPGRVSRLPPAARYCRAMHAEHAEHDFYGTTDRGL